MLPPKALREGASMRHSDERLTSVIYTDVRHFPLFEKVSTLPRLDACTQIRAQISGKQGNVLVDRGKSNHLNSVPQAAENEHVSSILIPAGTAGILVPPRGLEPRTN